MLEGGAGAAGAAGTAEAGGVNVLGGGSLAGDGLGEFAARSTPDGDVDTGRLESTVGRAAEHPASISMLPASNQASSRESGVRMGSMAP